MNQIPKIIHYCWFGEKPLSKMTKACIRSWRKYCPDYKIIQWNEKNFNINQNVYIKQAYEVKKWAFVSDYVRLHVLYKFGGIYLDTDVELLKNIDKFLDNPAFTGFESRRLLMTALIGAEKSNEWIRILKEYYKGREFIKKDGSYNLVANNTIVTNISRQYYKTNINNEYQKIENIVTIYPREYFSPKDFFTRKKDITSNSYSIHHFDGSWTKEGKWVYRLINYLLNKDY